MRERDRLALLRQHIPGAVLGEEAAKKKKRSKNGDLANKSPFSRKLTQAGIALPPRAYVGSVFAATVGVLYIGTFLGWLFALTLAATFFQFMISGFLEERAQKRKRKIIPQLAPFIDAIASSLSSGFNIEAAIVTSAESVPAGILRSELDRVVQALGHGLSVRDAMGILRDRITGKEVTSLVVALSLFASMGGSVLEPFRRLARKLREQQQVAERAVRDLVMVKQAFYILFFLTLGAPAVLSLVQPSYLSQALSDAFGRIILQVGAILVIVAYVIFKRITNIKV